MIDLLITWAVFAAALMLGANLMSTVHVKDWGTAFGAAAAFGVLNALLGWLITPLVTALSIPAIIVTLGIFALFIHTIVNMILLKLADAVVGDQFEIESFGGLFGLALTLGFAGSVAGWLT